MTTGILTVFCPICERQVPLSDRPAPLHDGEANLQDEQQLVCRGYKAGGFNIGSSLPPGAATFDPNLQIGMYASPIVYPLSQVPAEWKALSLPAWVRRGRSSSFKAR